MSPEERERKRLWMVECNRRRKAAAAKVAQPDLYAQHLDGWRKECKVSHDTQGGKKIECLWLNYNPQLTLF